MFTLLAACGERATTGGAGEPPQANNGANATTGQQPGETPGPITLKLTHMLPPLHEIHTEVLEPFAREVEQISNGRITVELYPANALGTWGGVPISMPIGDSYDALQRGVVDDDEYAVADWGIASEMTFHQLTQGKNLKALGFDIDDEEAIYHYKSRQAFIWPYDSQARLIGEHIYEDPPTVVIEQVKPEEILTPQRAKEIHQKLLREYNLI